MNRKTGLLLMLAVALAAIVSVGCATKKFVRETVAPVQQKVQDVDRKNVEQDASLAKLDKSVSVADERAQGADSRAGAAAREAARANEQAATANTAATQAQAVGEKGIAKAGEVETSLNTRVENLNNFQMASSSTVLFDLGMSVLTDAAKQELDGFAGKVGSLKNYAVEVQGFTDSTGDPQLNLELSRKRAAAVVRYLTLDKKIPLFRVQTLGYGEENPSGDNKTRDGRKENRRVEVKLYSAGA
jgi:outer membrane protein OmpA-like peptidoglycan-associated protein